MSDWQNKVAVIIETNPLTMPEIMQHAAEARS
jgi:hypothetical protein